MWIVIYENNKIYQKVNIEKHKVWNYEYFKKSLKNNLKFITKIY